MKHIKNAKTKKTASSIASLGYAYALGVTLSCGCALATTAALAGDKDTSFTPAQVTSIEKIVHNYIVNNPQVLVEATRVLQKQAVAEEQKQIGTMKELAQKESKKVFDRKDRMLLGSTTPKVLVAAFFSYQCPNCRASMPVIDKLLQSNKDMQVIIINWPFEGEGDVYASQVAMASAKQNKFKAMQNALMGSSGLLTKEKIDKIAQEQGLDMVKLQQDIKDGSIDKALQANFKLAESLKLIGVPTIFVANEKLSKVTIIPGKATEANFQKAIEEVR
jgi:protein-disulfide isomerase